MWMLKLCLSSGATCGCVRRGKLLSGVSSRTASFLLRFGGGWVDVKVLFFIRARRAVACVVRGSFRASRIGLHR